MFLNIKKKRGIRRIGGSNPPYIMSNIFLPNGYINVEYFFEIPQPFVFLLGGRGTGKTYGSIKFLEQCNEKFIYMRRTDSQLNTAVNPLLTPFNISDSLEVKRIDKSVGGVYEDDDLKGIILALSTFYNIRSFDATDYSIILYDEFLPLHGARRISDEGTSILQLYETINRNREINGTKPVKMVCFSNSVNIFDPVLTQMGISRHLHYSLKNNSPYIDEAIYCHVLKNSEISEKKKTGVLYNNDRFGLNKENIDNELITDSLRIKKCPLSEYTPYIILFDNCIVWLHKNRREMYITKRNNQKFPKNVKKIGFRQQILKEKIFIYCYINRLYWCENAESNELLELYVDKLV